MLFHITVVGFFLLNGSYICGSTSSVKVGDVTLVIQLLISNRQTKQFTFY